MSSYFDTLFASVTNQIGALPGLPSNLPGATPYPDLGNPKNLYKPVPGGVPSLPTGNPGYTPGISPSGGGLGVLIPGRNGTAIQTPNGEAWVQMPANGVYTPPGAAGTGGILGGISDAINGATKAGQQGLLDLVKAAVDLEIHYAVWSLAGLLVVVLIYVIATGGNVSDIPASAVNTVKRVVRTKRVLAAAL